MKQQRKQWSDMNRREKAAGITGLAFIGLVVFGVIWGVTRIHTPTAKIEPTDNMTPASQTADSTANNPAPTDNTTPTDNSTPAPAPQPTTAQQVTAWRDKYGGSIQTLANDFSKLSTDATNGDISATNTDCVQIQTDVKIAQGYPAIPDAQTASDFSSALSYYDEGAQDCIDGTNNFDTSLISKGSQEMSQGTTKMQAAANDMKALAN